MLSKSLSTSEKFAALVTQAPGIFEFCHALYPLIVAHTDDFGRLQGDPFTVKYQCYPASPRSLEEFSHALKALHDVGLALWYQVSGKKFVQIVTFYKHQQGLHKRTRSAFPRVPGLSGNAEEIPGQEKGTKENLREENRSTDSFEQFWTNYPKKVGKDAARKAWEKRRPDQALVKTFLGAVAHQRQSPQWRKDGGQFIPNPATWLNQGRWQDELQDGKRSAFERPRCQHEPTCATTGLCYRIQEIESGIREGRCEQIAGDSLIRKLREAAG